MLRGNRRLLPPVERVRSIVQHDLLLGGAVVQVALLGEAASVDAGVVSADCFEMLVGEEVLVGVGDVGAPDELPQPFFPDKILVDFFLFFRFFLFFLFFFFNNWFL